MITLTKPSSGVLGALVAARLLDREPEGAAGVRRRRGHGRRRRRLPADRHVRHRAPDRHRPVQVRVVGRAATSLTLVRNDDYWGDKAKLDKLIFRPIPDNAARLQALQTGEIQGYDLVEPQDIATIEGDSNLQVLDRPAFNVGYVGINQAKPPMDKLEVRQAIAHGLDRQARRGRVLRAAAARWRRSSCRLRCRATRTTSPSTTTIRRSRSSCSRTPGLTLPVKIEFWYPSDVSRPYMPDPKRNFEAFTAEPREVRLQGHAEDGAVEPGLPGQRRRGQHAGLPARLDGRLRRRRTTSSARSSRTPSRPGASTTRRSSTPGPGRDGDRPRRKRIAIYQDANRADHGLPARRAVRAHAAGARVPGERQGYVPSPVSLESFATRHDRAVAE